MPSFGTSRISIFTPRLEKFNLWFGVLPLPLVIADCVLNWRKSEALISCLHYLSAFIFLNWLHVILSFMMLFLFPEMRSWARASFIARFRYQDFLLLSVAAILVISILNFLPVLDSRTKMLTLAPFFLLRSGHLIWQSRGLASLYNWSQERSIPVAQSERPRRQFHIKLERLCFQLLYVPVFFRHSLVYFKPEAEEWFKHFAGVGAVSAVVGLIVAVALIINCAFLPQWKNSNKPIFMLRLLYLPLGMISVPALMMGQALHGIEYLGVYVNMSRRTQRDWTPFVAMALPWMVMGIFFFVKIPVMYRFDFLQGNVWVAVLSINLFFEFSHYFLDGLFFRFQRPEVQQHVGPLLSV